MTTNATARRTFYVHRAVHVAQAGAENALCGVRLLGAIDTTADATCDRCKAHRFETTPGLWDRVEVIGDGELHVTGGLPESTAGFPTDRHDDDVEAPRLRPAFAAIEQVAAAAMTGELRHEAHCARNGGEWVDPCTCTPRYFTAAELAAEQAAAAAPAKIPTPKRAGHPALRNGRVEVNVSRPNTRGTSTVYRTGRFVTEKAARRWAEATRQPGERASITYYSAADGWRPHAGDSLTDAGWRGIEFVDVAVEASCARCGSPEASLRHSYPAGHVFAAS